MFFKCTYFQNATHATRTHTRACMVTHTTNFVPNTHVSTADEDSKSHKRKALPTTAEFGGRVPDSVAWGVAWTPGTRVHSRLCFAAWLVLGILQQRLI